MTCRPGEPGAHSWYVKDDIVTCGQCAWRLESDAATPIMNQLALRAKKAKVIRPNLGEPNKRVRDIRRIAARDGYTCAYCDYAFVDDDLNHRGGVRRGVTIDHRLPLSRGGTDRFDNKVLACQGCNCRKGALTEEEYRGFLASGGDRHALKAIKKALQDDPIKNGQHRNPQWLAKHGALPDTLYSEGRPAPELCNADDLRDPKHKWAVVHDGKVTSYYKCKRCHWRPDDEGQFILSRTLWNVPVVKRSWSGRAERERCG